MCLGENWSFNGDLQQFSFQELGVYRNFGEIWYNQNFSHPAQGEPQTRDQNMYAGGHHLHVWDWRNSEGVHCSGA